jgi:Ni,Fe-hydrogenase III small subunit
MSLTTYISLTNKLKAFATAHYQIKRIGFDFEEQRDNFFNEQESYPAVFVTLVNTSLEENQNTFSLIIECLDLIQHDRVNINFIVSDCQLILNDIYLYMRDGSDNSVYVSTPPTVDTVNNSELDYCAGGRMGLDIEVDTYSVCAIPMGTIPEPTPNCEDATYDLTIDGEVVDSGSIASGVNAVIPIDAFIPDCGCPDGSLIDENGDFILDENGDCISGGAVVCEDANYELTINDIVVDSGSIPSGDTQVIPIDAFIPLCEDATAVLRDTNNDVISTTIIPSGGSEDITAPDGNIEINSVQFDTVLSGGTKNVEVRQSTGATEVGSIQGQYFRIGDSTVNVNGSPLTDVKAEDTLNITVVDSTDASVSVTLSGGNKITIPSLPCAPVPTCNDAYELGVDFFTLNRNNPFGNTNRFTDILGTQIYATAIVIDWLSGRDNDETVLAYRSTVLAADTFANQTAGEPYTVGAFSGFVLCSTESLWRLYNKNGAAADGLNYAPFNHNNNVANNRLRSKGDYYTTTTANWIVNNAGSFTNLAKTNTITAILEREFTYTELGL